MRRGDPSLLRRVIHRRLPLSLGLGRVDARQPVPWATPFDLEAHVQHRPHDTRGRVREASVPAPVVHDADRAGFVRLEEVAMMRVHVFR